MSCVCHCAESLPAHDRASLSALLRISLGELDKVRREDPSFPQPFFVGRMPRWSPEVIRVWMAEGTLVDGVVVESAGSAGLRAGGGGQLPLGQGKRRGRRGVV